MTYVRFESDSSGDVVDLLVFCSHTCFANHPPTDGVEDGGNWPCLAPADYDRYCATCSDLVSEGLSA